MTITITIDGHSAEHVREEMRRLLGSTAIISRALTNEETSDLREAVAAGPGPAIKVPDEPITQQQAEALVADATKPARERGKPSHGAARRTKAEIAEDEAADKADAALRAAGEETGAIVLDKNLDDEKGSISDSPEDRVDPDNPEDVAQDAADEAAETAAQKAETGGKLTLDGVRKASGLYAHKFGVAAAAEDIREFIGMPMLECPEDQYEAAIGKINDAVKLNPKSREIVNGAAPTPTDAAKPVGKRTATKDDVRKALARYALKYDGQDTDPTKMPFTEEDGRKCLTMRFGEDIKKLSQLTTPEDFGQALTDIESMIAKNPFGREVKVA